MLQLYKISHLNLYLRSWTRVLLSSGGRVVRILQTILLDRIITHFILESWRSLTCTAGGYRWRSRSQATF